MRGLTGTIVPLLLLGASPAWAGGIPATPVMTLFGRRGQIMSFDLFDNTGGNYNFAVAALSGSGKSVALHAVFVKSRNAYCPQKAGKRN